MTTLPAVMQRAREVRARTDLPPQSKVIHDALIDCLNLHSGGCFPYDETLAERCGMSVPSLRRYQKPLKEAGLIAKAKTGRAPVYTFPGLTDDQSACDRSDQSAPDRSGLKADRSDRSAPERSERSNTERAYKEEQNREQNREQNILAFEMFWGAYPRQIAKKTAHKKFDSIIKAGEATSDELIHGAVRYQLECKDREPRYIKHPTTWLNGGCWADEQAKNVAAPTAADNAQRAENIRKYREKQLAERDAEEAARKSRIPSPEQKARAVEMLKQAKMRLLQVADPRLKPRKTPGGP